MPRVTKIQVEADAPWHYEPGSPEAMRQGCTCSQDRNNGGKGELQPDGYHWFPSNTCPIHGIGAVRRRGVLNLPSETNVLTDTTRSRKRRTRG
jgi:hypothetical protein